MVSLWPPLASTARLLLAYDWPPTTGHLLMAPCAGRRLVVAGYWPPIDWPPAPGRLLTVEHWPPTTGRLVLAAEYWPPSTGRIVPSVSYDPPPTGRLLLTAYYHGRQRLTTLLTAHCDDDTVTRGARELAPLAPNKSRVSTTARYTHCKEEPRRGAASSPRNL